MIIILSLLFLLYHSNMPIYNPYLIQSITSHLLSVYTQHLHNVSSRFYLHYSSCKQPFPHQRLFMRSLNLNKTKPQQPRYRQIYFFTQKQFGIKKKRLSQQLFLRIQSNRSVEEQLSGGLRQLAEGYLRQRHGLTLPDRASHPGRSSQPYGGPEEHEPAGRKRTELGGVEVQERADQRKGHSVRTQTKGECKKKKQHTAVPQLLSSAVPRHNIKLAACLHSRMFHTTKNNNKAVSVLNNGFLSNGRNLHENIQGS